MSGGVLADETITNVAELTRATLQGVECPRRFDVVATLSARVMTNDFTAKVMDESGFGNIMAWMKRDRNYLSGDIIRFRGTVARFSDGLYHASAGKADFIAHGPVPQHIDASADDIYSGRLLYAPVRVSGVVADAFRDESSPDFTFLVLVSDDQAIYLPSLGMADGDLAKLIDASVSVIGYCTSYRGVGPRSKLGYEIYYDGPDAITVLRPAPADPFSVPALAGGVLDVWHPRPGESLRRKVRGTVLAAWRKNRILVRTAAGELSTVDLAKPVRPACGAFIEAAGLPETDFYHLNLSRATWRESEPFAVSNPPPEAVTANALLRDADGRRKFDVSYHGRTVRLSGTVSNLPGHDLADDGVMHLKCGEFLVPVDASARPAALDGLVLGCEVEVTGVCVLDTENWRPQSPFPHIRGLSIVIRGEDDVLVLSRPSWWTTRRLLAVIGSLFAALLAILVWNVGLRILIERRGRQLFRAQIAKAESELRVDERTRLAVELHDSISQNLTGVALEINAAGRAAAPGAARRHLSLATRALKSCRNELRNYLWDLRNDALAEHDMAEAIRQTLAPQIGDARLAVRFNVPRTRFTDQTAHAILRIVRELAVNAVRHGGATEIRVAGSEEAGWLRFSVQDNGRGFDPAAIPGISEGHFGLQGIRERARGFNGSLEIDSAPGRGARITVALQTPRRKEK